MLQQHMISTGYNLSKSFTEAESTRWLNKRTVILEGCSWGSEPETSRLVARRHAHFSIKAKMYFYNIIETVNMK